MAEFREANPAHVNRVFFIGDPCPADATPYAQLRAAGGERVPEADARPTRSGRRRRRRDQHAIHVRHDRLSQGRHALEPQHRQQRLLDRRGARLHAGRSAVLVRAAVPLLRLRARRARRLHARRLSVPARILRCHARPRSRRSRKVHRALRRADDVPRRARASGLRSLRHLVAADRHHGRRAVPGAADAARHRSDEDARADDRLRPDRDLAGPDADAARRRSRRAHADRWPRHARNRGAHRRSGRPAPMCRRARMASCGRAATW